MTWTFLRLIGIRGALAIIFAMSTLTFYAMWKYEVARKHKILVEFGKAQVEADTKRRMLQDELEALRKRAPKAGEKVREVVKRVPSDCTVPAAPVMQDAIREANAARSGA